MIWSGDQPSRSDSNAIWLTLIARARDDGFAVGNVGAVVNIWVYPRRG